MKMRAILGVTALLTTGVGYAKGPSSFVGKTIPAFSMTSTTGEKLSDKSLRGKVYVLDFWATWCGPCKEASPSMDRIQRKFQSRGVRVIGANVSESNPKAAREYTKKHGYTYTVTMGPSNEKLAETLGARGIPLIVVVGKDGKVAKVFEGFGAGVEKEIEATITRLLG
jgi:thiol-disulfide isomerase/thioredoxin